MTLDEPQRRAARRLRKKLPLERVAAKIDVDPNSLRAFYQRERRRRIAENEMPDWYREMYANGRRAWHFSSPLIACPISTESDIARASAWRAGWHDADIEAGNSTLGGRL